MKKRLLLLVLVLAMAFPMLMACDPTEATNTGTTKGDEVLSNTPPADDPDPTPSKQDKISVTIVLIPLEGLQITQTIDIEDHTSITLRMLVEDFLKISTLESTLESIEWYIGNQLAGANDAIGDKATVIAKQTVALTNSPYPAPGTAGLPDVRDLNGYQYNAYVRSSASGNGSFYCEDFWIDPSSGNIDALSFAVMERNQEIETDFNCSIRMTPSSRQSQFDEMQTFSQAGKKYELAILVATDAALCAQAGLLSNLKATGNTQNMNLGHEAFDQNSIDQLTINNSLYYLSGDMNISTIDNAAVTLFNTDLFAASREKIVEALGNDMYGNVYGMVANGKWTIDSMLMIAGVVTHDARPDDGALRFDKDDIIGYYEYTASPLYYYYGCGMRLSTLENHYPELTILKTEAEETYNYLFNKLNPVRNAIIPVGSVAERGTNFKAGSVLFSDFTLWDVRRDFYVSEMDIPYGILPIPTRTERNPYLSVVHFQNCVHLWAIPTLCANKDNAAFMMHVMAAYSGENGSTMDTYYKTMRNEVARDDGSRTSLNIIRRSLVYDIALIYSTETAGDLWGNYDDLLLGISSSQNNQYDLYTSTKAIEKAEQDIQDIADAFSLGNLLNK